MRSLIISFLLIIPVFSFSQLIDGSLMDEGRKMISQPDFIVQDIHEGVIFFELAVDRAGKVTSAKVLSEGTTVISTPARIKAKGYVMTFAFDPGTYYPEFHHVRVKVTLKNDQK